MQPQTTRTRANLSQFLAGAAAAAVRVAFLLTAASFALVTLSSPALRNAFITGQALPAAAAASLDSEEVGGRAERSRSATVERAAVRASSSTFLAGADRGDVRVGGADTRAELTEPKSTSGTSRSSRDVTVSTTLTSTSGVAVPASRRSRNTLLRSSTLQCNEFNRATDVSDTEKAASTGCCGHTQKIKFVKNHRVEFNRDIQLGAYVVRKKIVSKIFESLQTSLKNFPVQKDLT